MKRLILAGLCLGFSASFAQPAAAWFVARGPYYRGAVVVAPRYGYYRAPAYYYHPPVYVAPPCGYYPYGGCY
jgi:hypothetical protein